jgi:hypothetical protein
MLRKASTDENCSRHIKAQRLKEATGSTNHKKKGLGDVANNKKGA